MNLACVRGRQQEYEDLDTKKRYWSVSEDITVLDPHAFDGVDEAVLEAAAARGKSIHVLFGLLMLAEVGAAEHPHRPSGQVLGGHFDACAKFVSERKPKPEKVEESSVNEKMGYAGTPDLLCLIDDEVWLLDLKTGSPRAVHAVQLHAYKRLTGYTNAKRLGSLYTKNNGTYRVVEHTHEYVDFAGFQAGLAVLNWRRHRGVQ